MMKIFHSIKEWQAFRRQLSPDTSLGFVPTMGNLHLGHASLLKTSCKENHHTATSLFINPTQFNQPQDYSHYPRTLKKDLELLEELHVDFCLIPEEQHIYKDGYRYRVLETEHQQCMEGQQRPGHFTGVLTVVLKLFNLIKPTRAYFGEKDYQQFQLIRDMASAFFIDVEVKSCSTIREASKLAYSSRNHRLTAKERTIAETFAQIFHQNDTCDQIKNKLLELGIDVEYLEEYQGRRFAAVRIGNVRLIDNYALSLEE